MCDQLGTASSTHLDRDSMGHSNTAHASTIAVPEKSHCHYRTPVTYLLTYLVLTRYK